MVGTVTGQIKVGFRWREFPGRNANHPERTVHNSRLSERQLALVGSMGYAFRKI
jgi:hypothetical protein